MERRVSRIIESEIEAVALYSSGAVVTRVAALAPAEGVWPAEVRIADLPLALDDASVKVTIDSGAGVDGPRAESLRISLEAAGGPALEPPEEEALLAAREDVPALDDLLKSRQRLAARLAPLLPPVRPAPAEGEAPPPSPHVARLSLLDFQQQRLEAVHSEVRELEKKLRRAREVLDGLEDQKRRAAAVREPRPNELRKTVVVTLGAPRGEVAEGARLVLEYHVPAACWAPAYSLHFDGDWLHATLAVRAIVAQRTGEDWRNVNLTLSTAAMQAWTELPELASVRLGRWQAPPKSGWRPAPPGADKLYADYDRDTNSWSRRVARRTARSEAPEAAPPGAAPAAPGELTALYRPSPQPVAMPLAAAAEPGEFTRLFSAPAAPAAAPGRPPAAPPAPPQIAQPSPAALDYPALYMPRADEPGRGKLTRREAARAAESEADRLSDLPPGYFFPRPVEGFDYAYQAALPVEIPSDGRFHSIPIAAHEAGVRRYYVTVPREAADVFRFAEIDNPLDAPLLPGPAEVYAGSSFLMTVPLRLTPSKATIKLGLGVEPQIKVARNTSFAEEAMGMMGGSLNLNHTIDIELRNLLRMAVQVEVRERVPVTRDGEERLKVTATAEPAWEPYDPPEGRLRGGYRWKVEAPPGERIRLHAAYTIGMPAKLEIANGNRREQ
jgi:hypothetical protein